MYVVTWCMWWPFLLSLPAGWSQAKKSAPVLLYWLWHGSMAVKEGRYQIGSETRESRRDILSFLSPAYDTLILVIIKNNFLLKWAKLPQAKLWSCRLIYLLDLRTNNVSTYMFQYKQRLLKFKAHLPSCHRMGPKLLRCWCMSKEHGWKYALTFNNLYLCIVHTYTLFCNYVLRIS